MSAATTNVTLMANPILKVSTDTTTWINIWYTGWAIFLLIVRIIEAKLMPVFSVLILITITCELLVKLLTFFSCHCCISHWLDLVSFLSSNSSSFSSISLCALLSITLSYSLCHLLQWENILGLVLACTQICRCIFLPIIFNSVIDFITFIYCRVPYHACLVCAILSIWTVPKCQRLQPCLLLFWVQFSWEHLEDCTICSSPTATSHSLWGDCIIKEIWSGGGQGSYTPEGWMSDSWSERWLKRISISKTQWSFTWGQA